MLLLFDQLLVREERTKLVSVVGGKAISYVTRVVLPEEKSVQNVEDMDILLPVVRETRMTTNPGNRVPASGKAQTENSVEVVSRSGKQANYVDDEQSRSTSEDDAFAFSFTEQACSVSASPERLVSVSINGITKEVLVGFGSVSNLIGKMIFQELTYQGLKAEPQKCTKKLYVYGGQELEVVGQFQAENSVVKAKVKAGFVVVKKGRCLPGYSLNIADVLSRLKNITASNGYVHDDEYVLMITLKAVPVALRMQEIEEASARDAELQVVHECLRSDGTQ